METELTPNEQIALHHVEKTSGIDIIINWFSVLFPFLLIGIVGVWNKSVLVVACAGITFVILVLIGLPRQIKRQSHLKSAVQKLKKLAFANQPVDFTKKVENSGAEEHTEQKEK